MGTISYTVHFSATKSDIKKNVELAQSHLRIETKEVIKILNMIDDPKLKATYGAA
jgi:hypothetical protein